MSVKANHARTHGQNQPSAYVTIQGDCDGKQQS